VLSYKMGASIDANELKAKRILVKSGENIKQKKNIENLEILKNDKRKGKAKVKIKPKLVLELL